VVVVHGYDGSRVACAVLPSMTDRVVIPQLSSYSASPAAPAGSVQLDFRSSSVQLSYNFAVADTRCATPSLEANSCGVKIYSGSSCAKFQAAGLPFYNNLTMKVLKKQYFIWQNAQH